MTIECMSMGISNFVRCVRSWGPLGWPNMGPPWQRLKPLRRAAVPRASSARSCAAIFDQVQQAHPRFGVPRQLSIC